MGQAENMDKAGHKEMAWHLGKAGDMGKAMCKGQAEQMYKPTRKDRADVYHLIFRGYQGRHLFRLDQEKLKFLYLLNACLERTGSVLFAFVLMNTHVHLLVQSKKLQLLKKLVICSYTGWFSWLHQTKGLLFERDVSAFCKTRTDWQVDTLLYILNNPVEAGICQSPGNYRYSSYYFYTDKRIKLRQVIRVDPSLALENFESHGHFKEMLSTKMAYQAKMKSIKYK